MSVIIFVMIYRMKIKTILIVYRCVLSREMQFRCDWQQTCWKQCEIGVVMSQNWSLQYRKVQIASEQLWHKYSENCAYMVFWNYNCCFGDDWRGRIESRAANRRKADWIRAGTERRVERYMWVVTKEQIHSGYSEHWTGSDERYNENINGGTRKD